jgi:CubicO group peptidase (beta-lactamase class C family)
MILFVLLIASITFNMASFAQTDVDKIDELINRYHKISKFNGCILVAEKGKIIYENALGFANADQTEKLTLEHSFRLASVSKQFTAMAIVILKERGKIGYQDDVRKYIPEFPFKSITIRHLLTHTSGLPSYSVLLDQYWDTTNAGQDEREVASNKNALKLLVEHQPTLKFNPGDRYEYCNTGYMLLALIVARISNQSFQEFMKHNIFQPLGMVNTYVNEPTGILPEKKRAHGLKPDPEGEGFIPYDYHYQNGMFGDGGIISNIKDMFKWDQALYTEQLVSKPTLDEAFSPTILNDSSKINYGFGWSIIPVEEGMIVAHGGGWLGFNSFILREITRKITIIQLYNMPGIPKDDLAFTIYDILSGRDYFLPIRE